MKYNFATNWESPATVEKMLGKSAGVCLSPQTDKDTDRQAGYLSLLFAGGYSAVEQKLFDGSVKPLVGGAIAEGGVSSL